MAQVKFKSQEEFEAFKKKAANEFPVEKNPLETKGPEDQNVKVYTRPDMREGAELPPQELTERAALNKKLRDAQMEKEETPEPKSFSERHPKIAEAGEAIKNAGGTIKEELKRVSKNAEKLEQNESEEKEPEEEEPKKGKKSKKSSKHSEDEEIFGEDEEPSSYRSGGRKPFSEDYKEVYSGKKVMAGEYKEVFKGQMGSGTHKSGDVPKTHAGFLEKHPEPERQPQQERRQTAPPKMRAPMVMPRIGGFGDGNIKIPTVSFGNTGKIPKIGTPSLGNHKVGKGGNIPSINIPTLGKSTLIVGSGMLGKSSSNKIGTSSFGNIPAIGNWGKAPLKTELNLPDIGNLTIMGAGKKKGSIGINMGGDIPRFSLGTPEKKKKV